MDGLTAKVFRTYNASMTLQDQLKKLTEAEDNVNSKVLSYNRANRAVAILCNHQVCMHPRPQCYSSLLADWGLCTRNK